MGFAACVVAALGYGLVYAALPSRAALRARRDRRAHLTRLLLALGGVLLLAAAAMGATAFGPTLGPAVVLAAATAGGSVLVLVAPLFGSATDVRRR